METASAIKTSGTTWVPESESAAESSVPTAEAAVSTTTAVSAVAAVAAITASCPTRKEATI